MKFTKSFLALLIAVGLCASTNAQRAFDVFGVPRAISLSVTNLSAASNATTNGPIDIRMLDGIAKVSIFSITNTATTGGTLTAQLYGSTDQTNIVALGSYALSTNSVIKYTNNYYGTSTPIATNNWVLPGVLTTPTAATAGFATKYLVPQPFTNSGSINIASPGWYDIGFNAGDALRYLYIVYTPGGSTTNFSVGALVTGLTHDTTTQ